MKPSGHPRAWWRTITLEPEFYKRQLSGLLLLAFATVTLSAIVLAFFYSSVLNSLAETVATLSSLPGELEQLSASVPSLFHTLVIWITVLSLVTCITTLLTGFVMLTRLAGPLYRLKRCIESLGRGDLWVHVRLRKGDEFQDLADDLNSTAARIQLMIMACKENLAIVETLQAERFHNERLGRGLAGMREALGYFTTVEAMETKPSPNS